MLSTTGLLLSSGFRLILFGSKAAVQFTGTLPVSVSKTISNEPVDVTLNVKIALYSSGIS